VDAGFALVLEVLLDGISARFWMGLQSDHDLAFARLRRTSAA
jgi:plasmid maintenance system antidote protein VapI